MKTVTIPKEEYVALKKKADTNEDLLVQLVRGLEDIRHGRVKEWKPKTTK
ncbi:MAG: hypothetical protein Q7R47_04265 [Candidatus Diapherotrites archaeon]|nr:hypothetical protein [Candidatus Diapherotrites archaeon]